MATNLQVVTAARPDIPLAGSLYTAELFMPMMGDPGFLAPSFAYSRVPFGTSRAIRLLPDWILGARDRADTVRKINQEDVGTLDEASFQTFTIDAEDRGLWAVIDYRQQQVAEGLGAIMAQQATARRSVAHLVREMELVMLNGGSSGGTIAGVNVATLLGGTTSDTALYPEVEVTETPGTSTTPFVGTADPWTSADADAVTLIKNMIAAYVARHQVRPNTMRIASRAFQALENNNSFLSLLEGPQTTAGLLARLRAQGFANIYVGKDDEGLKDDVMILSREDSAGGDAMNGYNPFVVGATDQIDRRGEDYVMGGGADIESPMLASLIGYRAVTPEAGSMEKIRAACNYGVNQDYRGLVRAVDLFAER